MPNQTFSEELYDDTALKDAVDRMAEVMKTHATKAYVDKKVAEAGGDSIEALSEAIQAISQALSRKQDQLTIDSEPVEGSTNPISSGAVYTTLTEKQDRLLFDDVPTENSENMVKSGAVYETVSELKENLDDVTDAVSMKSYNLVNCNSASFWTPAPGKNVSVSIPSENTVRVTSNVAQTYAAVRSAFIDVSGADTVYVRLGNYSGTGQVRCRFYGVSNGSLITNNPKSINRTGGTYDVSAYEQICVELTATTNTASDSHMDYSEILVAVSSEALPYEPYMLYEPIGTEALNLVKSLNKNIIPLNTDVIAALVNAPFRSVRAEAPSGAPSVLSILHFSDLHADTDNLRRIVEFKTAFEDYIDDAICTGDMVRSKYSTTAMNFWKSVDGADKIMMCIGNHDVWREDSTEFAPGNYISQQAAYDEYIAPYAAEWGIVYTQGHTYFYKDYTDQKIRMIALDMMLVDTERSAQLTWFVNTLASAKTTGFSVVIAQHFAPRPNANFECNFTALDRNPSTTEGWSPGTDYMDAVNDFINSGGDFICWLGGHTHCDYVCFNPNYTNQLFVTITCAACNDSYSDQARIKNTKSQDAFNVIAFDTYSKLIKILRIGANTDAYYRGRNTLTINYSTQKIVASN